MRCIFDMDWSNEKILEFITNYESEPILWNPKEAGHKKKDLIYDAWVRIKNNVGWACTIDDLKKKRDSLMAYYRQHLNKKKKSIKSGPGMEDVYNVNWFAFSALNSFLQPIYDCKPTINTQINEEEEEEQMTAAEESTNRSGNENTQRAKRARYDLGSEINTARQQMTEAFNHVKNNSHNDEYEIFGKLIASKLRKIQNTNIKEILMNDIHNIVFKACMVDRHTEPTAQLPQSFLQTNNDQQFSHSSSTNSPHQPYQSHQSTHSQQLQSPQSPVTNFEKALIQTRPKSPDSKTSGIPELLTTKRCESKALRETQRKNSNKVKNKPDDSHIEGLAPNDSLGEVYIKEEPLDSTVLDTVRKEVEDCTVENVVDPLELDVPWKVEGDESHWSEEHKQL